MISRTRRFVVAMGALCIGALVLHGRCATLLLNSGDAALSQGKLAVARTLYLRALWFAPHDAVMSERVIFSDLQDGRPAILREALQLSAQALRYHPRASDIWLDRAFCATRLGQTRTAAHAFWQVSLLSPQPHLRWMSRRIAWRLSQGPGGGR